MSWKLDSDRPIYTQILERMQLQIVSGIYSPGSKIPSVRELAAEAGVNPNTMQKALSELERYGLVITQRTCGRTVTEDISMIQNTKKQLAKEEIVTFIKKMKELGLSKDEVIQIINSDIEGE